MCVYACECKLSMYVCVHMCVYYISYISNSSCILNDFNDS